MKIKATTLVDFQNRFLDWYDSTFFDELQLSNELQYRFKIFSGKTQIAAEQNGVRILSDFFWLRHNSEFFLRDWKRKTGGTQTYRFLRNYNK